MIYLQPITFYAIMRNLPDPDRTEIAEHPDGAMKAYAERWRANEALMEMKSNDWRVDEILLVPPPMTSEAKRARIAEELRQAGVPR
jgi:hypothetical protein